MFKFGWRWKGKLGDLQGIRGDIEKADGVLLRQLGYSSRDIMLEVNEYIRRNWSPSSPSSAGTPPAIVTGNLDTSGVVVARDMSGRFSGRDRDIAATLIFDTTTGNYPDDRIEYASIQEYGSSKQSRRPFLEPAMNWATVRYKSKILRAFKDAKW